MGTVPEEGQRRTLELDRGYRRTRPKRAKERTAQPAPADPEEAEAAAAEAEEEETLFRAETTGTEPERWQNALLARLHRLSPDAFEEFALYLLRLYGLELERVGGSGDEGIDGIGTAPISPMLSSCVAVQVKRYDPNGRPVGRETVALFQRDAQTKGAEPPPADGDYSIAGGGPAPRPGAHPVPGLPCAARSAARATNLRLPVMLLPGIGKLVYGHYTGAGVDKRLQATFEQCFADPSTMAPQRRAEAEEEARRRDTLPYLRDVFLGSA